MFVFGRFATRVLQLQTRKHGEVVVDSFWVCWRRSLWDSLDSLGFRMLFGLARETIWDGCFLVFCGCRLFGWSGLRWVVWLLIRWIVADRLDDRGMLHCWERSSRCAVGFFLVGADFLDGRVLMILFWLLILSIFRWIPCRLDDRVMFSFSRIGFLVNGPVLAGWAIETQRWRGFFFGVFWVWQWFFWWVGRLFE
jgi:hypothetical protein